MKKLTNYTDQIYLALHQQILITKLFNQAYKPIINPINSHTLLTHSFVSSGQFQSNTLILPNIIDHQDQILQYTQQQNVKHPHISIGLIIANSSQNEEFMIYGTGTLIHNNIVLTSAQNIYSRRLSKQHRNIKFIPYLDCNKYSRMYDVRRVYYPKQYTNQSGFQENNFAILELQNNLSTYFGYVGLKFDFVIKDEIIYLYGYQQDDQTKQLKLIEIKQQYLENLSQTCIASFRFGVSGTPLLIKDKYGNYSVIGMYNESQDYHQILYLTEKIKILINQWTVLTSLYFGMKNLGEEFCKSLSNPEFGNIKKLNLLINNIGAEGCKHFQNISWNQLKSFNLSQNNIGTQGCKYLKNMKCPSLTFIDLTYNNITAQGCESISLCNWIYLQTIYLDNNKIQAKGCEFLKDAKWIHLQTINLSNNKIGDQGCQYLRKSRWPTLVNIYLIKNTISAQGCKFLKDSQWPFLVSLNLHDNKITEQGCYFLKSANWKNLISLTLWDNNITYQGCKQLKQAKWFKISTLNLSNSNIQSEGCKQLKKMRLECLTKLILSSNNINDEGCRHLIEAKWQHLTNLDLKYNSINSEGLNYLKNCNWPNLNGLQLQHNNIRISLKFVFRQLWPRALRL